MGGMDSNMTSEQKMDRIKELSTMEQNGELDDAGREELSHLRESM